MKNCHGAQDKFINLRLIGIFLCDLISETGHKHKKKDIKIQFQVK